MDESIQRALERDRVIDITTTGRRSGRPRRKELWFHNLDGDLYISGNPGRRGWYANLVANGRFTFHLKGNVKADIPATASPITDPVRRRDIITRIHQKLGRGSAQVEAWVERSPLVQVHLEL